MLSPLASLRVRVSYQQFQLVLTHSVGQISRSGSAHFREGLDFTLDKVWRPWYLVCVRRFTHHAEG